MTNEKIINQASPIFEATEEELIQLTKFWVQEALEMDYWMWANHMAGGYESRRSRYAWKRVGQIADIIGDVLVDQAVDTSNGVMDGVYEHDPYWTAFNNGGAPPVFS